MEKSSILRFYQEPSLQLNSQTSVPIKFTKLKRKMYLILFTRQHLGPIPSRCAPFKNHTHYTLQCNWKLTKFEGIPTTNEYF